MMFYRGLAGLLSYLLELIKPRLIFCVLLTGLAAAVCSAQDSATSSGAAKPVKSSNPADRVVLKVGTLQLTQADFETMISDLEAQQGPADLSRRALGDKFAQLFMLSQRAVANHLDSAPEVVRQLALDRDQILSNAEFSRLKDQAKPTEQEISAYYSAHLADYDTVDMRRVFIWSSNGSNGGPRFSPQQAKALAEAVQHAYVSGGDVAKVIHDTPHGPEDVVFDAEPLPFQRGELPIKLEDAAFALKQGEWKELNDAPGTYVFLQVVKRGRRDLKEVSPQIEKKLQAEKLREELNTLKKNAGIWMDEEYFAPASKMTGSSAQSKASAPTNAGEEKDEDKRQK